jgi:hypothetical protein
MPMPPMPPMPPRASRPTMPGYGLPPAEEGLLPWEWAEQRLVGARQYWLATARPDGRPHLMPVWGVWWGRAAWFSTGARSVKAVNLTGRPGCCLAVQDGPRSVVVEGVAERLTAPPEVVEAYDAKYRTSVPPGEPVFRLTPRVAFGLSEVEDEFQQATRWEL